MNEPAPLASAVDLACQTLTAHVASGRWPGDFTLIEADLSEQLAVSRSTVREALRRLESQGLVVKGRSRTLVVRRLTRADVTELYELRELLEAHAASRAATHFCLCSHATQQAWAGQLRFWEQVQDGSRLEALSDANQVFHTTIHTLSGNSHLPRLLDGTLMTLFISQFRPWLRQESMVQAAQQHVLIGHAIASGNAAEAAQAMQAHVQSSAATILALGSDAFAAVAKSDASAQ